MVCYTPLQAFRAVAPNESGRRPIVFSKRDGFNDLPVKLACGQCAGCRLERSRQWAVRCMHEAQMYDSNCFITLTYADSFMPEYGSLVLKHFQDFMKRLRKRYGSGIRFFHCGEYGDKYGRPHYHACLFNHDFSDKVLFTVTRDGHKLYNSASLSALWPFGFSVIGEVTFESAAYVARYVMKKRTGNQASYHYTEWDSDGVVTAERKPEYVTMSRRPGIGSDWIRKFGRDVYPDDFVLVNGKKARPPRFYDGVFELDHPDEFHRIKVSRVVNAKDHADNNTPDRLKVRERVQWLKLERLKREGVE